jgi:hypothetical protein
MCIEHVPGQCPVVKRAHLQRHRVRQGDDRTEVHPHDRMVKRLLQHVNAVSPAEGKRDKQMPLPPFSVEDLNVESGRAVGGIQRGHNLLDWRCGTGREVDVLGRTLH